MNFAGSRTPLQFNLPELPGSADLGHANATGMGGFGTVYGNAMKTSPAWDRIASTNEAARSAERALITKTEAETHSMGLSSLGAVKSAKLQAEAAESAAKSKANGSMVGSALSMAGTVAGAALMFSDATLKENIKEIDDGLSIIKQLKPKQFNYIPEFQSYSDREHRGFIAQEYKEVLPEATYNSEENGKMCIDLNEVIAPLVSAVQQLEKRISEIEAKS